MTRSQRTHFAEWLRAWLADSGVTEEELERLLDVQPRTVRGWLAGRHVPTETHCQELAEAIGTPVNLLLEVAGRDRYF